MNGIRLAFVVTLITAGCTSLWAQAGATAQIAGTVRDSSGLPVPGAEVKVTQTDTGAARTVTTGADGAYVIPNLPVGPYQFEVSKTGFSKLLQSGIVLQVASNPTIDATLQVGSISEQVSVQADAAMVETHSTGVGTVVDQRRVVDLPLNGRLPTQLIFLAGAASVGQTNDLVSGKNFPTEQTISVGGGLSNGVTYLMDGGTHNDPMNNLNLPLPFPDVLQEFKVETSALQAQYGHHAAAAVNAVTKSGTNEIHGDAFEFLRNGDLNARDFFAASRDTLKRNQYGGTLGGPIRKNRLFFFAGFQGTVVRSDPPSSTAFIPTPAMLAGNFTTIAGPQCNSGRTITLKAPFVNNQIAPSLLNPSALKMDSYLPATSDPCGKILYGILNDTTEQQGLGRMDYQKSEKHSLFGRYYVSHYTQLPGANGDPLATSQAGINDIVHSFVLGDTYVAGPNLVNSFRGTFNQATINKANVPYFSPTDLGINIFAPLPEYTFVTVTSEFGVGGGTASLGHDNTTSFEFSDSVSWVRGSHQIAFGAEYIRANLNGVNNLQTNGSFTFSGQTTGLALADFLVGIPSLFTQSSPLQSYLRQNYIGLYVQDAWKLTPRLTLNAGIRWEPFLPTFTKYGFAAHFDPSLFAQGVKSSVYVNAPAGLQFPGDPGYPGTSSTNTKMADFAPRIGIVWDPKGDGRQTIRASYGIFYDAGQLFFDDRQFAFEGLWGAVLNVSNPAGGFSNPFQGYPGGNPFPFPLQKTATFALGGEYYNEPLHLSPAYLQQWNLSIQRQIRANWLVSASYIGNETTHLPTDYDADPAVYIPGNCVAGQYGLTAPGPCSSTANTNNRRVLYLENPSQGQYFSNILSMDDGGTANYNAMLLSFQRRLSNNITLNGNYTWSHCISDPYTTELGTTSYNIAGNRRADRSNCDTQDRHNIMNLSAVAQSPKFSNRMARLIASDWRLSAIVSAQSGNYFSVLSGIDNALTGQTTSLGTIGQRQNLILPSPYAANPSVNQYLNPAAFATPANGTYGNLGADNIRGPGQLQFDMGLSRLFPVREKQTLEFRWEVFNVLNRLNPSDPVATFTSGTFGKITSDINAAIGTTGDPRIMQFALKYVF